MPVRNRKKITCDWCGKEFERWPSQVKKHNFCCRQCLANFSSKKKNPSHYNTLKDFTKIGKHLSKLNQKLNPTRMTQETRSKLRKSRLGSGDGVTYTKLYGVHEHRVVAEKLLGRQLKHGEVVHHIDGNKRNNDPDNICVFPSQSEHAKYHIRLNLFFNNKGGDAK